MQLFFAFFFRLFRCLIFWRFPRDKLKQVGSTLQNFYNLENVLEELEKWQHYWKDKSCDVSFFDLFSECKFFPNILTLVQIFLTLPSTCSTERSFSTLRRVKTWLRATTSENRLNGLCMLSIHREHVAKDAQFAKKVVNKFGENPRKLQFVFKN